MLVPVIVFAITYILIASEKVDKTVAAVLGAATVVFGGLIPHELALGYVDLNVIYLLVGMMIIVNILSTTGVFEWLAIILGQRARGSGVLLLVFLLAVTAVLSAFLDNVTTIILVAPITILITQILEIPTLHFLILEAVFSNIGGTATLVGDPPNVLIGSQAHIEFMDFIINLGPISVVIAILSLLVVVLVIGPHLKVSKRTKDRLMSAKPREAIVNPKRLMIASTVFALVILGFFVSHQFDVQPGLVAIAGGFLMALLCRMD
ncbi:MAG: hypothetical protein JW941_10970, partial [Candidatus Coatesbacteria bacterium]|nr:hypothetical protein [Candidatus Coatesbacteria bacterium]